LGLGPFEQVTLNGIMVIGYDQRIDGSGSKSAGSVRYCECLGQLHNYLDWIRCNRRSMRHLDNAGTVAARKLVYWLWFRLERRTRACAWPNCGGGAPGNTSGEWWPSRLVATAATGRLLSFPRYSETHPATVGPQQALALATVLTVRTEAQPGGIRLLLSAEL
jgi:hypothetical protein